jgi:hypothetical protein
LVVRHAVNQGKGAAVRSGVALASGRRIVFMDADMATDLTNLDDILGALDEAHVVVGSRAAPGSVVTGTTAGRAVMGRVFNRWARMVTGVPVRDFQCGFKAFRAPAAKVLFSLSRVDGFAFDVDVLALAARIGYTTIEVPVRWEAVAGSTVRPLREAPGMGLSAALSGLRWAPRRPLSLIRAMVPHRADPGVAAAALSTHLPQTAQVLSVRTGAVAVLPFVDSAVANREAERTQGVLPDFAVAAGELAGWELLGHGGRPLCAALAAA